MAYTKYSLTPANNNAAPPDGAPEGMLPSAVNDTMRDMMAQIRDVGDGIRGGTYTMTAPVITGGSINGTTVGAGTASTGAFTTLSATGVATFSAGSASAPAITTTGDTNTGIFFPAADTIAFTEGGVESMRITSAGDVGIGTNNPSGRLHVVGNTVANGDIFTSGAIEVNTVGTGDRNSVIDFHSSGVPFSIDFSTRVLREPGVNGNFLISNTGTGSFRLNAIGAAPILFETANTERCRIDANGNLNIGNSATIVGAKTSIYGNATISTSGLLSSTGTLALSSLANGVANKCGIYMQTFDASNNACAGTIHISPIATSFRGDFISTYMADGAGGNYIINQFIPSSGSTAERMRIDSSGNLLINGTSNPVQAKVGITQTSASGWAQSFILGNTTNGTVYTNTSGTGNYLAIGFYNNGSTYTSVGTIQVSGSTTGYNTSSDYRLKENIAPMTGALATIALLKPVTYNWKVDGSAGQGFIAHELQEVVPECVTGEKDAVNEDGSIKPQGIDTSFLVATLTAAIQELKAEFDAYKATHP
jgi:hypothetical protein